MFARILSQEILDVSMQAAVKVFCAHCRQHVFYLKKETGGVRVENLAPLENGRKPDNFGCPACSQDIRAYAPEPTLKTEKGYVR